MIVRTLRARLAVAPMRGTQHRRAHPWTTWLVAIFAWSLTTAIDLTEAHAGGWPGVAGDAYLELSASHLRSRRVAAPWGVERTPDLLTNSHVRFYGEVLVAPRWELLLDVPILDVRRAGEVIAATPGDPGVGVRSIFLGEGTFALAPELFIRTPIRGERNLKSAIPVGEDVVGVARLSSGMFAIDGRINFHAYMPQTTTWWRFAFGYRTRPGHSDQLLAHIDVHGTISEHTPISITAGGHLAVTLATPQVDDPILVNGVGPEAEFIGWFVRVDYRFPVGIGAGIGVDGGYWVNHYPAGPSVMVRVSYRGSMLRGTRGQAGISAPPDRDPD